MVAVRADLPLFVLLLFTAARSLRADMGQFFVRNPEPIVASQNDEVSFECSLRVAAEQIRWLHDGHFVHQNESGVSEGNHSSKSSLLVVRVQDKRQEGDYQCVAWFGASALTSLPARLTLAELQQFPPRENETYEVTAGNTVAIHCEAPYSSPPALLQYYRNGEKVTVPVLETTGTLILQNVTAQDAGKYQCKATNYLTGQSVMSPHVLTLKVRQQGPTVAPYFLSLPRTNYTVRTGSNVTLECSAVGNPVPTTTWEKYGGQLLPERSTMVPGGLHLSGTSRADEGTYVCTLNNGVGQKLRHIIALHLQEPPVVIMKSPPDEVVLEGGEVILECQVKGSPTPQLMWVFNGEAVQDDDHIHASGGKLHIKQLEKRHAGIFQCFATNSLGTASGSSMLRVSPKQISADAKGDSVTPYDAMIPPSRPNVTRLSDTSVMVRWDVPHNNGMPILFFKVQHRELSKGRRKGGAGMRGGLGDGGQWKTSNEDIPPHIRSYEVDNLRTDHTYRFRIAAAYVNNDNKLGPNSARFHLHRGNNNALTPPRLLRAEALSPSLIQIHWEYTNSARVPVDGFYVYYRAASTAGDYIQATVEGEGTRSFNITHLAPDTAYEMKLQSFTIDEASNFSTILTQKTLPSPTETPAVTEEANSNVTNVELPGNQMYVVLGAVLGGLALLAAVFLGVFLCNRHRSNNNSQPTQGSGDDKNMFALNSKNLINGRLQQNGFLRGNKMNITTNPLADSDEDKNQNVVEMSIQNNNRGRQDGSEAGASSAEEADTRLDPDGTTSDVNTWRGSAC
ncbi:interference hedgehog isoform X2 [Anabrus simplex]|uniref:interference hedgehog isoform X2 n=1 Tax=Anabrus simplex TaxID=316456 RepID=UPI0035A2818C